MFWIVEADDGKDGGGSTEGDTMLVAGDRQDCARGWVGAGDVSVVEIDDLNAVGATATDDGVLPFAVKLERDIDDVRFNILTPSFFTFLFTSPGHYNENHIFPRKRSYYGT